MKTIRAEIVEKTKLLKEEKCRLKIADNKRYMFANFLSFSIEEKDYIKSENPLLYKQLLSSLTKNLQLFIDKKEAIYPYPVFSPRDDWLFTNYFNMLIEKEETEQIAHYVCIANTDVRMRKLIKKAIKENKNISSVVAKTILKGEVCSPINSLALQMTWPAQKEYFIDYKKRFEHIGDYKEQDIEKYNSEAVYNLFEVITNIEELKLFAQKNNYAFNQSMINNNFLLNFIVDKKLKEFEEVLKIEVRLGLSHKASIAVNLLWALSNTSESNQKMIGKIISSMPEFFASSSITHQKYFITNKVSFVDYLFSEEGGNILRYTTPLVNYLSEQEKRQVFAYQFYLFTRETQEKYLHNIPQNILLELADNFQQSISGNSTQCAVILEKYLLNINIKKQNIQKKLHKI